MEKLYNGIFQRNEKCDRFLVTTYIYNPFQSDDDVIEYKRHNITIKTKSEIINDIKKSVIKYYVKDREASIDIDGNGNLVSVKGEIIRDLSYIKIGDIIDPNYQNSKLN